MLDLETEPMGLYSALTGLFVFGIFLGTRWLYGMRAYAARRRIERHA